MPKRLALLIGINYANTPNALEGCVNDVLSIASLLTPLDYECRLMLDDGSVSASMRPDHHNIMAQIRRFVGDARSGDKLFFQYSGHGTSIADTVNGDEPDGRDEALCPSRGPLIRDDDLRTALENKLPADVELVMLLDCCHSGTGADLRYTYEDVSECLAKTPLLPLEYSPEQWVQQIRRTENPRASESAAPILCISGCRDNQTSADTVFDARPCGAMTAVFLRAYNANKTSDEQGANLRAVMQHMTCMLRCYRYEQVVQLSLGQRASDELYTNNRAMLRL
jgi:hypothetical protein